MLHGTTVQHVQFRYMCAQPMGLRGYYNIKSCSIKAASYRGVAAGHSGIHCVVYYV